MSVRVPFPAVFLFACAAACSPPSPGGSRAAPGDPVRITGPPQCDQCRLEMTLEMKLRDRPDLGRQVVGSNQAVVRDSRGRTFLVHGMDASQIHLFDASGEFLRSIGSRGQGPGQFSYIYALALDDEENLYAFDRQRMTVLSPDFELLETRRAPFRAHRVLFAAEGFVVASPAPVRESVLMPLHVLARDDLQVVRSFGGLSPGDPTRDNRDGLLNRGISKGIDGQIWSHPRNRYLIEEWDPTTGTRLRAFERVVEWFEPWLEHRGLSTETPPQPGLTNAWQDDEGLLWSISTVGAEQWHEGLVVLSGFNDLWIEYPEKFWDSHIEVIDPVTGLTLLSERVPQALGGLTNDGLIVGRRYPEGEVYQVDLWRLKLQR